MYKIIVVGAGHGGLVAAARLALAGHSVDVYEARQRDALGHEWEDRFDFDLLSSIVGIPVEGFPEGSWRYRGDCTFVSPAKRTQVDVHFDADHRQKIMWRKPLIAMLLGYAEQCGVVFHFGTKVEAPMWNNGRMTGVRVDGTACTADLVIDASGVFSSLRQSLPASWHVEALPRRGDVFYANRAYYNRLPGHDDPAIPFEIYLIHEGEAGLSWLCTNAQSVDVLIGRIYPIDRAKVDEQLAIFRRRHPWLGREVLSGGQFEVIPVRRPLPRMVGEGYAAVGDSAFMTFPMNGMGIDLSLKAGLILAECINAEGVGIDSLWHYNRRYLVEVGAFAAKNEGLKNALLSMPSEGVDFLYENHVIESADLAGGGANMTFGRLVRKLVNGLKKPRYFFAIVKGLVRGGKNARLYAHPPKRFDPAAIEAWARKIEANVVRVEHEA